jgi:deoxyribodipyrimidine photolyase-related protein
MPSYVERNALNNYRALPSWFWTGETKMRCVGDAVDASLDNAYAHHIQRLMITGNIALLLGCSPQHVHEWYLGVYIDAFEWVEVPNTIGMSQHADNGLMATKPYVSPTRFDPNSTKPFGSVLDAPIG